MEATSLAPLPPRPGDQYRLRNLRSSMRNVMTRRSKMSSAISTTDSTEEPNHRLHWLPRLDRRVTICEGERHADHGAEGPGRAQTEEPLLIKPSPFLPEDPDYPLRPSMPPAAALPPRNTAPDWHHPEKTGNEASGNGLRLKGLLPILWPPHPSHSSNLRPQPQLPSFQPSQPHPWPHSHFPGLFWPHGRKKMFSLTTTLPRPPRE